MKHRQAVHFVAMNDDCGAWRGICGSCIACVQFHVLVIDDECVGQMRADAVNPVGYVRVVSFHCLELCFLVEIVLLTW